MPKRILPLTDENLLAALPTPRKAPDECQICSGIGSYASMTEYADGTVEGSIPAQAHMLQEHMRLGEQVARNWIAVCPECGAIYYADRGYEFLIGGHGSEDCESYERITPEKVLKLPEVSWAREPGAELHELEDGTWRIVRHPEKNEPQHRS
jgi:hypothetical protein